MTKHSTQAAFIRSLADQMIQERFGRLHGTETLDSYFDFVNARQTAHLADGAAHRVVATAGKQRRSIKLVMDNASTVLAKVPLRSPRQPGATIWAEIALGTLLDLIENGADGAWFINFASDADQRGYVKTSPPMASAGTATTVTVARLVAGAGRGRMVRFRDRNPLNLRRSNLFLVGDAATCEGPTKRAKHDARALMNERSALRQSLAGAGYDLPTNGEA